MGNASSGEDLRRYREGYPDEPRVETPDPNKSANLRFFRGEIRSIPSGDFIENIQVQWLAKYDLLERHHGYIQWLFPIREHGMNYDSQKLEWHELVAIRDDPTLRAKLVKNYELMLDFYGLRLVDPATGEVERKTEDYADRFRNLNTHGHNYLRITRILKCLGELGFEHYKAPFLRVMFQEIFVNQLIPNARDSCYRYWIHTLRNEEERLEMVRLIQGLSPQHQPREDEEDETDSVEVPTDSSSGNDTDSEASTPGEELESSSKLAEDTQSITEKVEELRVVE